MEIPKSIGMNLSLMDGENNLTSPCSGPNCGGEAKRDHILRSLVKKLFSGYKKFFFTIMDSYLQMIYTCSITINLTPIKKFIEAKSMHIRTYEEQNLGSIDLGRAWIKKK